MYPSPMPPGETDIGLIRLALNLYELSGVV